MKNNIFIRHLLLVIFSLLTFDICAHSARQPKLTTVIVIDQWAYHYLPKIRKYFNYGLKELCDKGIFYTNAYHAHGIPETTTGHHAISTGTLPKDHGAILNQWIDESYKKVAYDNDPSPNAAVLRDGKSETNGKSPRNTMVDGLSDQFVLASIPKHTNKVFALSLKSYPAIAMANKLGKAIWFDDYHGGFTSSKYYFNSVPEWITSYNKQQKLTTLQHVTWSLQYNPNNKCYDFPDIKNYDHAGFPFSLVSRGKIPVDRSQSCPYELFLKTPVASEKLLELAKICVDQNFNHANDRMLLWISLSNLDLVCHYYGPDSLEAIDTIYQIDKQLQAFMDSVRRRVGENNCLFVLVADHGIVPIPEILEKRGLTLARRILAAPLMKKLNTIIEKKYHIAEIIKAFEPTYFVLNEEEMAKLPQETAYAIIKDLTSELEKEPGIKRAWSAQELKNAVFAPDQKERLYQTQLYSGRSGDIICMVQPYCLLTNYPTGTSHLSPYEYDTHVPLVLYQKNRFERKIINKKVWVPQLPVTLARILDISKPAASTFEVLPGVIS